MSAYKYDANNNISETNFRDFGDVRNSGVTTFIYDTKPNPFYSLGSIYHIVLENTNYLTANNLIEFTTWWGEKIKTKIEYNRNGLPATKQTVITGQTFPIEKYEYK